MATWLLLKRLTNEISPCRLCMHRNQIETKAWRFERDRRGVSRRKLEEDRVNSFREEASLWWILVTKLSGK